MCFLINISYFCTMKRFIGVFNIFLVALLTFHMLWMSETACAQSPMSMSVDDDVEISLLTCEPHDAIYSLYGHTAIRVTDVRHHQDIAVNFGVFDFTSDYFVLRFVFGLTDYMMGVLPFEVFLSEYSYYGCGVYQQRINMTAAEKSAFLRALAIAARPENVVYRYNFFYNNCTTKARDLIFSALDGSVEYRQTPLQQGRKSFRELVHLKNEEWPWARVGNDILLGVKADQNTNHDERQFLPQVLMNDFDSATIVKDGEATRLLVDTAYWVLPSTAGKKTIEKTVVTPTMLSVIVFCAILAYCLFLLFIRKKPLPWVDYFVVVPYGIGGLVLLAMIFSKHPTVSFNLQILMLNPIWLFLMLPCIRLRHKWHIVLGFLAAFAVCGFVQDYADGMPMMALSLSILAVSNIVMQHKSITERQKTRE